MNKSYYTKWKRSYPYRDISLGRLSPIYMLPIFKKIMFIIPKNQKPWVLVQNYLDNPFINRTPLYPESCGNKKKSIDNYPVFKSGLHI